MPSLRVYFVTHHNGCLTGSLMRTWRFFFDAPPPSAYGRDETEVLNLLQQALEEKLAARQDVLERYYWDDDFESKRIHIHINPQTTINKRTVIAKKEVPLQLTYLYSKLDGGGFRLLLPRFEWSMIVEDLSIADQALRQAVSFALLGEKAKWIFDFRHEGPEFVREWSPNISSASERENADTAEQNRLPTIHEVCDEWVQRAARRRLPFVVGTIQEMENARAWASRATTPQSLLLVGAPGVGKTAWVRRLAYHLNQWRRAEPDKNWPRLWSTSSDRIIAGQVYLGMWQKRCIKLLDELSFEGDYLYVDHIIQIFREQPGGSSIADILVPGLQSGQISVIGECTQMEFELFQRRNPDLVSLFHIVRLEPPSNTQMPLLLQAYQAKRNANLRMNGDALQRLVRHLEHFQRHISFPGKGFMFLDWLHKTIAATSPVALPVEEMSVEEGVENKVQVEGLESTQAIKTLYPNEISEAFSRYSGLPVELISDAYTADAAHIAKRLKARVIGQDAACLAASEILARFKAGLNDPERPCGSLLFVGPTGVGKTELAKQVAAYMFGSPERMIRLDMSEYMGYGSAQRLLTPSRGQSLVEKMRQQPLSLVLLDEIEKAHPEVFDLLLGVLGEGRWGRRARGGRRGGA